MLLGYYGTISSYGWDVEYLTRYNSLKSGAAHLPFKMCKCHGTVIRPRDQCHLVSEMKSARVVFLAAVAIATAKVCNFKTYAAQNIFTR